MSKITLNEGQQKAFETLQDFLDSSFQNMFLLEGAAGCLGEDTIIDYRRGKRNGGRPLAIKELYEKFHDIATTQKWRNANVPTYLKSYNPETGEIIFNEMTDIWMSGVKELYLMRTEKGRTLKLTMTHPLLTSSGFKKLEELKVGDEIIVQGSMQTYKTLSKSRKSNRAKRCTVEGLKYYPKGYIKRVYYKKTGNTYVYQRSDKSRLVIEAAMNNLSFEQFVFLLKNNKDNSNLKYLDNSLVVHHIDKNPFNNELNNLQVMTKRDHNTLHGEEYKWNKDYTNIDKIASIEFYNTEETYDISMKAPLDNFVLNNGLIVHNSGKTTTLSKFVEWAVNSGKVNNICMASPTHKALKVMKEMCPPSVCSAVTFSTIHSMLGLRHEITKDGKEIFVRDKNTVTKFPFYDFVIVDESSMIADQLFYEMEEQNYNGKKILFVGDSNQINPVNHSIAVPMNPQKRKELNIGHSLLEKIVRQAEGNPIIKYSQMVINKTFSFQPGIKEMEDEAGVVMISSSQQGVFMQLLDYYFKSEKFDKDANYCKVLAWRNATVDSYNKIIRKIKYGNNCSKIVLDEKLLVDRPIKSADGTTGLFNTNDDLVVKTANIREKTISDKTWKYYECDVVGDSSSEVISILHETEELAYKKKLDELAKSAKEEVENGKRLKKWKEYFAFQENFAQVKYNYAITAHNSQGSTYENCFVLSTDIEYNRKTEEKNRILYTALTRPKKMLYIL